MKEFENWKQNYHGVDDRWKTGAKQGWKAALAWVQNARFRSTDEPLHIDKPLYNMLEEELNENLE